MQNTAIQGAPPLPGMSWRAGLNIIHACMNAGPITIRGERIDDELRHVVQAAVGAFLFSTRARSISDLEDACLVALADAGLVISGVAGASVRQCQRRMKSVYVAGPYRSFQGREGVDRNIANARVVGVAVAELGYSPVIPHMNTAHLDAESPLLGDQFWLDATMELMRRCDAVVLAPGWRRSAGALGEVEEAERLGIPVFHDVADLPPPDELDLEGVRRVAEAHKAS